MKPRDFNTDWRKTASSIYRKPVDSKMLGSVELDVTELEQFIAAKRQQGLKITLTHFFLLAIARGFREATPELNCYIRLGKIIPRSQVDATLSVLIKDRTQMGSVRVSNADKLTLSELAYLLSEELNKSRRGEENAAMGNKSVLANIPWPFRQWLVRIVKWITIDLGLSFPPLGLHPDSFGSFLLTNIGSVGIDIGYPALLPLSNVSTVVTMGSPQSKAVVHEGQITVRRMITFGAGIDHRVADAMHAGRLFRYLKRVICEPELLESPPKQ